MKVSRIVCSGGGGGGRIGDGERERGRGAALDLGLMIAEEGFEEEAGAVEVCSITEMIFVVVVFVTVGDDEDAVLWLFQ